MAAAPIRICRFCLPVSVDVPAVTPTSLSLPVLTVSLVIVVLNFSLRDLSTLIRSVLWLDRMVVLSAALPSVKVDPTMMMSQNILVVDFSRAILSVEWLIFSCSAVSFFCSLRFRRPWLGRASSASSYKS